MSDYKTRKESRGSTDTRQRVSAPQIGSQLLEGPVFNMGDGEVHRRVLGSNVVCPSCYTGIPKPTGRTDARCQNCKDDLPINGKSKRESKKKKDEDEEEYEDRYEKE